MATINTRIEAARGCGYRKGGGMYLVSGGISQPCGLLPIPLDVCPCCNQGIKPARGWTWIDVSKLTQDRPCKLTVKDWEGVHRPDGETVQFDVDRIHELPQQLQSELKHSAADCDCPIRTLGKAGLLWIGGSFYKTTKDWTDEAARMGVSRRVSTIPKDFKLGETWVMVAHREAIKQTCSKCEGKKEVGNAKAYEVEGEPIFKPCPDCKGKGHTFKPAIFHAFKPTAIEYVVKGTETEEELDRMEARGFTLVRVIRDVDAPSCGQCQQKMKLVGDLPDGTGHEWACPSFGNDPSHHDWLIRKGHEGGGSND
jgi:hypothetical protein